MPVSAPAGRLLRMSVLAPARYMLRVFVRVLVLVLRGVGGVGGPMRRPRRFGRHLPVPVLAGQGRSVVVRVVVCGWRVFDAVPAHAAATTQAGRFHGGSPGGRMVRGLGGLVSGGAVSGVVPGCLGGTAVRAGRRDGRSG